MSSSDVCNPDRFQVWEEMDSNHRRRTPADLQSAPFGHSGIFPIFNSWSLLDIQGADGGIRTHDPEITNHVLWPTELHRHFNRLRDAKVGIFFLFANFFGNIFNHSWKNSQTALLRSFKEQWFSLRKVKVGKSSANITTLSLIKKQFSGFFAKKLKKYYSRPYLYI